MEPAAAINAPSDNDSNRLDFTTAVETAKLQALYNFAYGLSHEINNPLANIATRAQTLLADEKNPDRRRKLATIVQQAFRPHEMIADLMLFARPPALKREPTDLINLADTVLTELQAREQHTELLRTGAPGPLLATIDPTQIAVALKAILQNALEAVKQNGRVETALSAECTGIPAGVPSRNAECAAGEKSTEYPVPNTQYSVPSTPTDFQRIDAPHHPLSPSPSLSLPFHTFTPSHLHTFTPPTPHSALTTPHFLLRITDTGPGIPPHIRPHIFDPFYCGREAGRGLGLGLSKAWRIINLHNGQIEVASPAGQGATFTITLPVESA